MDSRRGGQRQPTLAIRQAGRRPARRSWAVALLLAVSGGALACGCVLGKAAEPAKPAAAAGPVPAASGKDKPKDTAMETPPQRPVQPQWQRHMLALIGTPAPGGAFVEAWSLFSAAGWSDEGQIMVLADAGHRHGRLLVAPPNSDTITTDRALSPAELQDFLAKLGAANTLTDLVAPAYDALVYEYVHAEQDGDHRAAVRSRFKICNPNNQPAAQHDAVIAAFQALRPRAATAR